VLSAALPRRLAVPVPRKCFICVVGALPRAPCVVCVALSALLALRAPDERIEVQFRVGKLRCVGRDTGCSVGYSASRCRSLSAGCGYIRGPPYNGSHLSHPPPTLGFSSSAFFLTSLFRSTASRLLFAFPSFFFLQQREVSQIDVSIFFPISNDSVAVAVAVAVTVAVAVAVAVFAYTGFLIQAILPLIDIAHSARHEVHKRRQSLPRPPPSR